MIIPDSYSFSSKIHLKSLIKLSYNIYLSKAAADYF